MRLPWLVTGLIALALGIFYPWSVHAESLEPSSTAVLGLEGLDVPATLTDEISEQLRQRVSGARDMRLVSGKDLVEVKLVFGCPDEAATCMTQAGKSMDAHKLIYGSVKRSGDDYAVWLKMFDVRRAKIESGLTETFLRKNADSAGIKAASARWFVKLTGRPTAHAGAGSATTVQVTSNVHGATVSLDGVPVGATGELPLTIADVAAGKHELLLAKAGHVSARQQITVAAGQTAPFNVPLRSLTEAAPQTAATAAGAHDPARISATLQAQDSSTPSASAGSGVSAGRDTGPDDGRGAYRTGFWVTLAAGLVSAGGAIKFGLDVADINKKLDPYRRFPCMTNQLCDSKGMVRPPLTAAERSSASTLNDEGNRDQNLQWICVGVGSVLGIASGYLFYKGYIDSDGEGSQTTQARARHGLRVFPTAGATSSGIVAEFDF